MIHNSMLIIELSLLTLLFGAYLAAGHFYKIIVIYHSSLNLGMFSKQRKSANECSYSDMKIVIRRKQNLDIKQSQKDSFLYRLVK